MNLKFDGDSFSYMQYHFTGKLKNKYIRVLGNEGSIRGFSLAMLFTWVSIYLYINETLYGEENRVAAAAKEKKDKEEMLYEINNNFFVNRYLIVHDKYFHLAFKKPLK